ncbi:hypothetical protein GCM10023318_39860 [Nocardia callitridis]|uniref:Uncharacterized protein n=1 Tax=Nocardia callitridis TaxID=648753 RepID=A0ABP9KLC7_9NOCA
MRGWSESDPAAAGYYEKFALRRNRGKRSTRGAVAVCDTERCAAAVSGMGHDAKNRDNAWQ